MLRCMASACSDVIIGTDVLRNIKAPGLSNLYTLASTVMLKMLHDVTPFATIPM